MIIDFINRMTELYFDGSSFSSQGIPNTNWRPSRSPPTPEENASKSWLTILYAIKKQEQPVCFSQGIAYAIYRACEDEKARFDRCHQKR